MHWRIRAIPDLLWRTFARAKPMFEWLAEAECAMASAWVQASHKRLMGIQWKLPPYPESFDHQIDQFYQWTFTRNSQWLERGVYSALALKGGTLLELCCGDGFNARNFYSLRSKQVVACDFDPRVIRVARRKNTAPNVSFQVADIRTHMPDGRYDNIVWDAAIEHFTPKEIQSIMLSIKGRLAPGGILSGHTVVERQDGQKQLSQHEYEFKNKEDLLRFFTPMFANVLVFETKYPDRHNLYFWASDSVIPFGINWEHASRRESALLMRANEDR